MEVASRAGRTVLPEKTLTKKDIFNAPMKAAGKALATTSTKKKNHPMKATGKALPPATYDAEEDFDKGKQIECSFFMEPGYVACEASEFSAVWPRRAKSRVLV